MQWHWMISKDAHIFSLIGRPHLYPYDPRRFLNVEILFTGCNTNVQYSFFGMVVSIFFSAYTTTCRNQYVFSDKYKKKELVHLPISTALTPKCKKEGQNIVFLRRKGTWTDLDISTCKTPAAAFQLLTTKDFDSAPRAHYGLAGRNESGCRFNEAGGGGPFWSRCWPTDWRSTMRMDGGDQGLSIEPSFATYG